MTQMSKEVFERYIGILLEKADHLSITYGYSEPQDFFLREAARKSRKYPEVLKLIEDVNEKDMIHVLNAASFTKLAHVIEENNVEYFTKKIKVFEEEEYRLSMKYQVRVPIELILRFDSYCIPDEVRGF